MVVFMLLHAKRFVALVAIAAVYWSARLPNLSDDERQHLAERFLFEKVTLPELTHLPQRSVRRVHPSLERVSSWISAVGGAVALSDVDGDGLPNDVCYVDTRIDRVILAPVPGSDRRYNPLALDVTPLHYDADTMAPMGCVPGDFNEDGRTDLLIYYWGRTPVVFLRRQIDGEVIDPIESHSFHPVELWPRAERWYTNAVTQADIDGDGHVDLVIGNYFPDGARILDANASGQEQMQHSMSRAFNGGKNRLLLWKRGTTGKEPTVEFGETGSVFEGEIATGWTLALGAADLDGDLLPELYVGNDFGPDRLLHNESQPGKPRFRLLMGRRGLTTPRSKILGRDSFKGMGVDFADVNGDGLMDIYVSNIAAEYALEESHFLYASTGRVEQMHRGIAPYVDRSEPLGLSRSGWGWGARLADFDNDGVPEAVQATGFVKGDVDRWPELHELAMSNDELISNPGSWFRFQSGDGLSGYQHNPFFVRAEDGRYYDIAAELGIDANQVTRGIATADVDGDGDLDFAVGNQWESSHLYRNVAAQNGSFLGIHLRLPGNRDGPSELRVHSGHPPLNELSRAAIGASCSVVLPDGRRLVGQVDGGNGHSGVRSPDLHFGLGATPADQLLEVQLHWRDSGGVTHQTTVEFSPGWHTVVLGTLDTDDENISARVQPGILTSNGRTGTSNSLRKND